MRLDEYGFSIKCKLSKTTTFKDVHAQYARRCHLYVHGTKICTIDRNHIYYGMPMQSVNMNDLVIPKLIEFLKRFSNRQCDQGIKYLEALL